MMCTSVTGPPGRGTGRSLMRDEIVEPRNPSSGCSAEANCYKSIPRHRHISEIDSNGTHGEHPHPPLSSPLFPTPLSTGSELPASARGVATRFLGPPSQIPSSVSTGTGSRWLTRSSREALGKDEAPIPRLGGPLSNEGSEQEGLYLFNTALAH